MAYEHTQTNRTQLAVFGAIAVAILVAIAIAPEAAVVVPLTITLAVLAIALAIFMRLTVTVDKRSVSASFGWGFPRRTVDLGDIRAVHPTQSKWWEGWGIRKVSKGWMFNVAGGDAVELELTSGRRFRIGTDDPKALAAAIAKHR